jgi:TFIIF-interacting CTD phosphatase-like protein
MSSGKHLVLDLDGTLISVPDKGQSPVERPYLKEFLDYSFENFDTVSVWTAAMDEWKEYVYYSFLEKHIPQGKRFFFSWTRNRCTYVQSEFEVEPNIFCYQTSVVKKLNTACFYYGLSKERTLIVDDTPSTYAENKSNALPINTYKGEKEDSSLLRLTKFLDKVLKADSFLDVEKCDWNW